MDRTRALALFAAVVAASGVAGSAQAASWLTVTPNQMCGSDGCFGSSNTFTQKFSASGQNGVVDISSLAVFRDIVGSSSYAVKVTFQLADGTEVSWGKFTLNALSGEIVTLSGDKVAWNTAVGDLTVKLDLLVPVKGVGGGGGGGGGFAAFGGGGGGGGGGAVSFAGLTSSGPLVRPSIEPPGTNLLAVPEPGTWALMIMGFGGAGTVLRRRKAHHLRYG